MLKNISMKVKLWGSFTVILLLLVFISFVSYKNLNHLKDNVHFIGKTQVPKTEFIGELKEDFTRIRLYVEKHAYEQSPADKEKMATVVNDEISNVRGNIKEVNILNLPKENKILLKEFSDNFEQYVAMLPSFYQVSSGNDYDKVHPKLDELAVLGEKTVISLNEFTQNAHKYTHNSIEDSEQSASQFTKEILLISVIAVLFGIIVSFFINKVIRRAVNGVVKNVEVTTQSVSEIKKSIDQSATSAQELDDSMNKANDSINELVVSIQQVAGNTNIATSSVDEVSAAIEEMGASINIVAESADQLAASAEETSSAIQEMMASIEQVAGNTENMGAGVEQISAAIEELSKSINGVNSRAINLTQTSEQTAETVEEMIVSIKNVAASAQTVNELSNAVKNDALEGTDSLNETLNGMKEISHVITGASHVMNGLGKSSEEIGRIIVVIENIAGQTNLLALNAAIEAARAGEHGKGFAVVADEVRKLAEQSASATKEISSLIKGIQDETAVAVASIQEGATKVEVGNKLAEKTSEAIGKITQGITQVTDEMNQIALATEEQTKNSRFITNAVENVKKQANEMTHSTKEEAITAEEIVNGILHIHSQVQQIKLATAEEAQGGHAIIAAVENVTNQSNSVTNATKEQALTADEIVRNINSIKEKVQEISYAANDQARYGKDIALEAGNVLHQTKTLYESIEVETKEATEVSNAIMKVNQQVASLK
ncbi:MCP four helix bundle domain-containing protein [Neobacillus sp. MM2021_6]|uniref:HAMP domain-containing methyl-accepting chemotaxis protein n=1 Tax=Bacillaceae TaxID=186817 RepID=UPI001407DA98|nr:MULTISPECIES: methyl-accepting chemotaxis protein [Bacillaceae]MBO0961044.1 MCP four helix bundle domain-containing protein [Neobacillus sp. MM2021_6]NHC21332.1 chemotaxis protein [Bacillus sp. MM2020_4]